jgi:lipopolysaccharide transport system permease protein
LAKTATQQPPTSAGSSLIQWSSMSIVSPSSHAAPTRDAQAASQPAEEMLGGGSASSASTSEGGGAVRNQHERLEDSWLALLNPWRTIRSLAKHRELLWQLATRAISERHKGSALGVVWLVAQPLLMLSVYTFVFSMVWKATWVVAGAASAQASTESASTGMLAFASMVFAGLVVYEIFSTSVAASPVAIVQNPNYVKKVVFPLELLPLSHVVTSVLLCGVGVAVLLIGRLLMGEGISRTVFILPCVVLPMALLASGVSFVLAALGTYFRDIRPIVQGVMLQVLFFMTPIFYPMERVPAWLREYLSLNPLASLVEQSRLVLVQGETPAWRSLALVTLIALVVFQLGYAFFMRAKRGFADVL